MQLRSIKIQTSLSGTSFVILKIAILFDKFLSDTENLFGLAAGENNFTLELNTCTLLVNTERSEYFFVIEFYGMEEMIQMINQFGDLFTIYLLMLGSLIFDRHLQKVIL